MRWVLPLPALLLVPFATILAFVRPNTGSQAAAVAFWLAGGCWLAATLPYPASALARRRWVALTGVLVLLVAGAIPFELGRPTAGVFSVFLVVSVAIGGLLIRALTGRRFQAFLEHGAEYGRIGEGADRFDELVSSYREIEGLDESSGRSPEQVGQELIEAGEAMEQMHPRALEAILAEAMAKPEAEPPDAEDLEFMAKLRAEAEATPPLTEAELATEVDRARGVPERYLRLFREWLSASRDQFERTGRDLRDVAEAFRPFTDLVSDLKGVSTTMRAAGPALVALAFLALWIAAVMLLWIVDPDAWSGLGRDRAQFGDFVYLAVSAAFGGTPGGIEAASPVARMMLVGEILSGATVLGAYLAAVWNPPRVQEDERA